MSNNTFHLRLAAITNYNDHVVNAVHFPLTYGICFDIRDKTIRKMNFVSFGPAFRLRMVYHSVSSHPCLCIYSSFKGEISVPKFQIERNIVERYYRPLYSNYFHKDDELLRLTSTSPKQERPSYLFNMKKTIVFILTFSTKISEFFDEKNEFDRFSLDQRTMANRKSEFYRRYRALNRFCIESFFLDRTMLSRFLAVQTPRQIFRRFQSSTQFYPINDDIYGLTDDQKQVKNERIRDKRTFSFFRLVTTNSFRLCSERIGSTCE